jgi:hypothetical protein
VRPARLVHHRGELSELRGGGRGVTNSTHKVWRSLYQFEPAEQQAPIPEPGTLILTIAGATAAVRRSRRIQSSAAIAKSCRS